MKRRLFVLALSVACTCHADDVEPNILDDEDFGELFTEIVAGRDDVSKLQADWSNCSFVD